MEILFATDGSDGSTHALNVLCDLPLGSSDHVTVLSVPVHQSFGLTMDGSSGMLVVELIEAEEPIEILRSEPPKSGVTASRARSEAPAATSR